MDCTERSGHASALHWAGSHCQDKVWKDRTVSYRQRCQVRVHFISLFTVYVEHIQNIRLDSEEGDMKIGGISIIHADDSMLLAESSNNLKILTKVKEKSAKAELHLNIKKIKIKTKEICSPENDDNIEMLRILLILAQSFTGRLQLRSQEKAETEEQRKN